ncbi:uncharacterized protein BDV14DRAFT_174775 [Aspergillus stella-maris]|uniref:uncharacterized protein n=1 Tax=Aspergillus stella-maris TaxID=1810926 RepID=UPI003CCD92A4
MVSYLSLLFALASLRISAAFPTQPGQFASKSHATTHPTVKISIPASQPRDSIQMARFWCDDCSSRSHLYSRTSYLVHHTVRDNTRQTSVAVDASISVLLRRLCVLTWWKPRWRRRKAVDWTIYIFQFLGYCSLLSRPRLRSLHNPAVFNLASSLG